MREEKGCATTALGMVLAVVLLVLGLVAGPARAQDASPASDADALKGQVAEIMTQLAALAAELGVEAPPVPQEALTRAIEAAVPVLPTDDGRSWASGLQFNIRTDVTAGEPLAADAEGYTVLSDGRACIPDPASTAEVAAFRRFVSGDFKGHQCAVTNADDDVWMLHSTVVAEGADRRLVATYSLAVVIEGDAAASRALGEARLQANVDLARGMGDYGLALLEKAGAGRTQTPEELADTLGRIATRLKAIGEELED